MNFENTLFFAQELDKNDSLQKFIERFHIPQHKGKNAVYLCGNSLGLLPKTARNFVEQEFLDWENFGGRRAFQCKKSLVSISSFRTKNVS